ncbi:Retrovirus-related Pol polyprotein from transposon.6 [Sesamum angolense]|uniref:Retrovirus-related Pol polyprotein from transposon.6 n=1 Tax=Sesamum angolense TaxID=2727404 RepID=A0AAE1WMS5_9LAMI|nr:Retrovirus-related Pol polyprotein from transposon.6 [Sesamum angolense]
MALMNHTFHEYRDQFVIVFIDEILVYLRSIEEHEQHLRIVLQVLKEKDLHAKLSKCEFWINQVVFLGHVISGDGVMPDPSKMKAIMEWRIPKNATKVELNLGQRRWIELLKDYDYTIDYHPGKANVVVDALSRKIPVTLASLGSHNLTLLLKMRSVNTKLEVDQMAGLLAALQLKLDFVDQIKEVQTQDPFLLWILERMKQGKKSNFLIRVDGVIVNGERICVPDVEGLRREILQEAHNAPYGLHPGKNRTSGASRIGPLAYRLALPSELSQIHDVFHVSMLRRYRSDPNYIIREPEIEITEELTYVEEPTEILDRSVRKLRNKEISMVKVKWGHHSPRELTWEVKEHMRDKYPYLFH